MGRRSVRKRREENFFLSALLFGFLLIVHLSSSQHDAATSTEEGEEEDPRTICSNEEVALNFSNTIIQKLGSNFITSTSMKCLNLEGNAINSIDEGAFDDVPALVYLNLARNRLDDPLNFGSCANLRTLILANQTVNYYNRAWNIRNVYPKLRYLDASGNSIVTIKKSNEHNIYYTDYSAFPVTPSGQRVSLFPELKYLDISNNMLSVFNSGETEDTRLFGDNITRLHLHRNRLSDVDLSGMENLVVVTLDNNNIERIIDDYSCTSCLYVEAMPNLRYFTISHNAINEISPNVFIGMPKLVVLDLSYNKLQDNFRGYFDDLISLEVLRLDNNELTHLPVANSHLNLTTFSVTHNKIKRISLIINFSLLRELDLSYNEITHIDVNAFSQLPLLEELNLGNNQLRELQTGWCDALINLRYLNLENNAFKFMESLTLSQSVAGIEINLVNNDLIHIKTSVLQEYPNNVTIYLFSRRKNETELRIN